MRPIHYTMPRRFCPSLSARTQELTRSSCALSFPTPPMRHFFAPAGDHSVAAQLGALYLARSAIHLQQAPTRWQGCRDCRWVVDFDRSSCGQRLGSWSFALLFLPYTRSLSHFDPSLQMDNETSETNQVPHIIPYAPFMHIFAVVINRMFMCTTLCLKEIADEDH
ncbi:hypothetical protein BV25DRAFT_915656 [Artomyces pyxidatus]|uniref:Uncharacterized protein n=1 Tax=Artomyces pyxidatus TaxID=48021 RepID=A0ACB8SXR3_9AGAM|nr:hypothetical protein BV25DRAFT_915656 [Artomyces pyxidatus]